MVYDFKGSARLETESFCPSISRSRVDFNRVRRSLNGTFTSVLPTETAIEAFERISSDALICSQRLEKRPICRAIDSSSIPNCLPHFGQHEIQGNRAVGSKGISTLSLQWVHCMCIENVCLSDKTDTSSFLVSKQKG